MKNKLPNYYLFLVLSIILVSVFLPIQVISISKIIKHNSVLNNEFTNFESTIIEKNIQLSRVIFASAELKENLLCSMSYSDISKSLISLINQSFMIREIPIDQYREILEGDPLGLLSRMDSSQKKYASFQKEYISIQELYSGGPMENREKTEDELLAITEEFTIFLKDQSYFSAEFSSQYFVHLKNHFSKLVSESKSNLIYQGIIFFLFAFSALIYFISSRNNIIALRLSKETLEKTVFSRTEELIKSVRAREMLIREIHHRVKNNLMMIESIINLEGGKYSDKNVLDSFMNIAGRIHTVSLIHERLYLHENLESINIREYICDLADYIIRTVAERKIEFRKDIKTESGKFSFRAMIPVGLLIVEICTNAIKHSLDNEKPVLKISFYKNEGAYTLKIYNSGKPVPEDILENTGSSLGILLITSLIEQMHASIEVNNDNGTEIVICIPEDWFIQQ